MIAKDNDKSANVVFAMGDSKSASSSMHNRGLKGIHLLVCLIFILSVCLLDFLVSLEVESLL